MKLRIQDKIINTKMVDVVKMPKHFSKTLLINRGQDRVCFENVSENIMALPPYGYINMDNLYSIVEKVEYMILTFESGLSVSIEGIDENLINEWENK